MNNIILGLGYFSFGLLVVIAFFTIITIISEVKTSRSIKTTQLHNIKVGNVYRAKYLNFGKYDGTSDYAVIREGDNVIVEKAGVLPLIRIMVSRDNHLISIPEEQLKFMYKEVK